MLSQLQIKATQLIVQNASAILTGVGVVGAVGSATLAGRAGFRAKELIDSEYENDPRPIAEITKKEKAMTTWHLFLPAGGAAALTVTAIVMANHLSAKRAAALAAAYGISERNFEEYKEKALEKLGVNKEEKLRDELAQDQVNKNYGSEMIIVGDGDVLFMDMLTGRFFMSSVEKVSGAMSRIHSALYHHMYASFSEFCQEVGLEPTEYTDMVGWNTDNMPEVRYSTSTTPDNRPCMTLTFSVAPKPDYDALFDR